MFWKFNKSGRFTVKSAYWLACETKTKRTLPEAFALPYINPLKEKIWSTLTAPKIKIFLLKLFSEALLVADLINARGMKIDERFRCVGMRVNL